MVDERSVRREVHEPRVGGDTVKAHGVMTGPLGEDSSRQGAFVWLAKQDDTIALVANASVVAG